MAPQVLRFTALATVCCLLVVWPVSASERSKRLYNKGLVEFHRGNFEAAQRLFDEAVAADPYDAYASYYLGVSRARQGDRDGAIAALQRALLLQPHFFDAALDLGIAFLEAGRLQEALSPLQMARNSGKLEPQACLYLGITFFRLGEREEARSYLECARLRDPELAAVAHYYLGLTEAADAHWRKAREHLQQTQALRPGSPVSQEAGEMLARLDRAERDRLVLYGSASMQYDSNVILAPSGDVGAALAKSDVGVTRQADGRFGFFAGAQYELGRSATAQLLAGYEFYQSLHFRLSEFDLQAHRASVRLLRRIGGAQLGVLGRYDYDLLDFDDFLREGTVLPYARISEGTIGSTELSFQLRRRDFLKPEFHIRDSFNYAPAIAQNLCLLRCDRVFTISYQFDAEETDRGLASRAFAYQGHQVGTGLRWQLPWETEIQADYAFRHEIYEKEPSAGRKDREHLVFFLARKALSEHSEFVIGYSGQVNFTNSVQVIGVTRQKLFEYERHIGLIGIEARY